MNEHHSGPGRSKSDKPKKEYPVKSDRTYVLRIRFSKTEMDALTEHARLARPNEKAPKVSHYIRDVLREPSSAAPPVFPAVEKFPERPFRTRVRLSFEEDQRLNQLADAAGTDTERYVRWRLLGVVI